MVEWLQKYSGVAPLGTNCDQNELEIYRKELKKYQKKYEKDFKEMEVPSDDEQVSPEEQEEFDAQIKKKAQKKKLCRCAISAPVDPLKKKEEKKENPQKTEEQKKSLLEKCHNCPIFSSLDDDEINNYIIPAFEEKKIATDTTVLKQIKEGDKEKEKEGSNSLYFVESGELDYQKPLKVGEDAKHFKGNKIFLIFRH